MGTNCTTLDRSRAAPSGSSSCWRDLNQAIGSLLQRIKPPSLPASVPTPAASCCSNNWTDRLSNRCRPSATVIAEWKPVKPNIDYHVEVERHYYSVPYQLVSQQLDARYTATTVEIFHSRGTQGIACPAALSPTPATTLHQHRPKSHQAHLEWTPSRLINWAATVGPSDRQGGASRPWRASLTRKPGIGASPGHYSVWRKPLRRRAGGSSQSAGCITSNLFPTTA